MMDWSKIGKILKNAGDRDDEAAVLSRRDALAGLGLAGLFLVAGPKLLVSADARPLDAPANDAKTIAAEAIRTETEPATTERDAADPSDVTDVSSSRWHHRHWRRRWRHRYWRRRHWRHRYWRRRHWRGRHWRRRRWY